MPHFHLVLILSVTTLVSVSSHSRPYTIPTVTHLTDSFPHVTIQTAFSNAFGAKNVKFLSNGSMATLALDKITGKFTVFLIRCLCTAIN